MFGRWVEVLTGLASSARADIPYRLPQVRSTGLLKSSFALSSSHGYPWNSTRGRLARQRSYAAGRITVGAFNSKQTAALSNRDLIACLDEALRGDRDSVA